MRFILLGFLTLCATGSIIATDSIPKALTVVPGNPVPVRIRTYPHFVKTCVLTDPEGANIQFIPKDDRVVEEKFKFEPDHLHECRVVINSFGKSDMGQWKLAYTGIDESKDVTSEVTGSKIYDIKIQEPENDGADKNETAEAMDIDFFKTIEYGARIDTEITITLSKKEFTEECYITTPEGDIFNLEKVQMAGVKVFPVPTNFVSCRVVIGPMEERLLGIWTLCGRHMMGNTIMDRCQPANISWAIEDPTDMWDVEVEPSFDYPVHFGGRMSPAVRGTGTINTCHVITPAGEDITVTAESDYPNLSRNINRDVTLCNITIANIDEKAIGVWVIYGTYRSNFNSGFNVVSRPMTFFLYDEENPHNQAYNVTVNEEETLVASIGGILNVTVSSSNSNRDVCQILTNTGETFDSTTIAGYSNGQFVHGKKEGSVCRMRLGPITKEMLGKWKLTGKFIRNRILFTEIQQPFKVIEEDPLNPIADTRYEITYLEARQVIAHFGESITMSTEAHSKMSTDSCHIRTPDEKQYILSNNIAIGGVEFVQGKYISCGVRVHVDRDENIGNWTLISRINNRGNLIEWRLPFTIRAEEQVSMIPKVASIAEGSDLYLRLQTPTPKHDTCTIAGPTRNNADRDQNFIETCGFIVRNITTADTGTWEIVYGKSIKYRAHIDVHVTDKYATVQNAVDWVRGASINQTIGPVDAVFCRVENSARAMVFEDFGMCRMIIDRVRADHEGIWKLTVARAGRVLTQKYNLFVKVTEPAAKPTVTTSVKEKEAEVILSCNLPADMDVTTCKFRDPSGQIILATQGIGEDRYSFNDPGTGFKSDVFHNQCGIRITNPILEERGIWRCAMKTEYDTYYGFLTVQLPWLSNGSIAEPTLKADPEGLTVVAGDEVVLRCSVPSAIQYCYFRTENGTVFNVHPGTSEWYQYAGAGFNAGECGIRFPRLQALDSGTWSCHVGFQDPTAKDQKANIFVNIEDEMEVIQTVSADDTLVIQGQVYRQKPLEYCRFLRIDGLGFKSTTLPAGYKDRSMLMRGVCEINIPRPTLIEQHPWTIVAKVFGREEIVRMTEAHLPNEIEVPEIPVENEQQYQDSSLLLMWACVLTISIALFLLGVMMGPRKNRQWTYRRTEIIRNSLRLSLAKRPLPDSGIDPNNYNNNNNFTTAPVVA